MYANVGLVRRSMLGRWAMFSRRDPKVEEAIETVHRFVDDCIERAVKRKERLGDRSAGERNILVYNLLDVFEDRVSLRYELLHLFLGANETIGIIMTNILFLVARNPHVWTRLREEVKDMREDELSFEKLKSLTYVQWTIKEGELQVMSTKACVNMQR
jgi:cytochrome P450